MMNLTQLLQMLLVTEMLRNADQLKEAVTVARDLVRQHPWVKKVMIEGREPSENWRNRELPQYVKGRLHIVRDENPRQYMVDNTKVFVDELGFLDSVCSFREGEEVFIFGEKTPEGLIAEMVLPQWMHNLAAFSNSYVEDYWIVTEIMARPSLNKKPVLKRFYEEKDSFRTTVVNILSEAAVAGWKNGRPLYFDDLDYAPQDIADTKLLAKLMGIDKTDLAEIWKENNFLTLLCLNGTFRTPDQIPDEGADFAAEHWLKLCPREEAVMVIWKLVVASGSMVPHKMRLSSLAQFHFCREDEALFQAMCARIFWNFDAGYETAKPLVRGVNGERLVRHLRQIARSNPNVGYTVTAASLIITALWEAKKDTWEEVKWLFDHPKDRWIAAAMFGLLASGSPTFDHKVLLDDVGVKELAVKQLAVDPEEDLFEVAAFTAMKLILAREMELEELPPTFADCAVARMKQKGLYCSYTERLLAILPLESVLPDLPVKPERLENALAGKSGEKPEVAFGLLAKSGIWNRYEIWQQFAQVLEYYIHRPSCMAGGNTSGMYLRILLDHLYRSDLIFPELSSAIDYRMLDAPLTQSELGAMETCLADDMGLYVGNCRDAWIVLRYLKRCEKEKARILLRKTRFCPLSAGSAVIVPYFKHLCRAGLGSEAVAFYRENKLYLDRPDAYPYEKLGKYFSLEEILDLAGRMNRAQAAVLATLEEGEPEVLATFMGNHDTHPMVFNARFAYEVAKVLDNRSELLPRVTEIYCCYYATDRMGIAGKLNTEILKEALMEEAFSERNPKACHDLDELIRYERMITEEEERYPHSEFYDDRTWLLHLIGTDRYSHFGILNKYNDDYEMGLLAVQTRDSLHFLSERLRRDETICRAALKRSPDTIYHVLNDAVLAERIRARDELLEKLKEL